MSVRYVQSVRDVTRTTRFETERDVKGDFEWPHFRLTSTPVAIHWCHVREEGTAVYGIAFVLFYISSTLKL